MKATNFSRIVVLIITCLLIASCNLNKNKGQREIHQGMPPPPHMSEGHDGEMAPEHMRGGPEGGMPMREPPFKWWLKKDVRDDLKLSDVQVAKISEIATSGRREEIKLRAEAELIQLELDNIMDEEKVDFVKAEDVISKFVQAHAGLEKQRMLTLLQIRNLLTKEQHLKLRETLMEKMLPKGRHGDKR